MKGRVPGAVLAVGIRARAEKSSDAAGAVVTACGPREAVSVPPCWRGRHRRPPSEAGRMVAMDSSNQQGGRRSGGRKMQR